MPKLTVKFVRCIQDSQEYGSNNEHMISRLFFTIYVDGKASGDYYADVKQTVGDDFETGAIEVSAPQGYKGPFNQQEFANCAERYFRSLVGSKGKAIRIEGAKNIRMQNNTYVFSAECSFESDGNAAGW